MKMMKVLFVGSLLASVVAVIGVTSTQAESSLCPTSKHGFCDCYVRHDSSEDEGILRTRTRKTRAVGRSARKSVRARNAERRQQRQLKRQRERDLDEFRSVVADIIEDVIAGRTARGGRAQRQVLLELLDEAIEMGDDELALQIGDELELCADPDPGPLGTGPVEIDPDSIRR